MDELERAGEAEAYAQQVQADLERRRWISRWILRGSIGIVVLGAAAWVVGLWLPKWLYDRARTRSDACFAKIDAAGLGDPQGCVAKLAFHGLRSDDRDAAASLEARTAGRALDLATQIAAWSTLDADARDAGLRAQRAADGDDRRSLVERARWAGAHAVVVELATASRPTDPEEIALDGVRAAILLGDLDGAKAIVAPRLAAGETGWSTWIGCTVGLTCAPEPGEHVQQRKGRGPRLTSLMSPWTLELAHDDPAPAALMAFADALEQQAELESAWAARIDAARIAIVTGDAAGATAAWAAAERLAADPRMVDAELPISELAGLAAAVLPPEEALGWLDRAGESEMPQLDRALILGGLGRDAEALSALGEIDPFDDCGVGDHIEPLCDALAWTKLALLLRTGAALPVPPDDTRLSSAAVERLLLGMLAASDDADALRESRWQQRELLSEVHLGAAAPMQLYVIGRLAAGADPEPLLAIAVAGDRPRRAQAALTAAATLRGDTTAAAAWHERQVRVDTAISRSPAPVAAAGGL